MDCFTCVVLTVHTKFGGTQCVQCVCVCACVSVFGEGEYACTGCNINHLGHKP